MPYKNIEDRRRQTIEYRKRPEVREYIIKSSQEYRLKTRYGISIEDYNKMLESQNSKCVICGQEETRKTKNGFISGLVVDHDHETGQVRALLCHKCNWGIGIFDEDAERLVSASEYIKKHKINAGV